MTDSSSYERKRPACLACIAEISVFCLRNKTLGGKGVFYLAVGLSLLSLLLGGLLDAYLWIQLQPEAFPLSFPLRANSEGLGLVAGEWVSQMVGAVPFLLEVYMSGNQMVV